MKLNDWIKSAKALAVPKKLFGDYWMEGELAVLCAESGMGKSILALQIAESIARGRGIGTVEFDTKPHKVLHIDLELTQKQFEMRYSENAGGVLLRHYRFSERLHRLEFAPGTPVPDKMGIAEHFVSKIEEYVRNHDICVVVIDSITHPTLAGGKREMNQLLSALIRLKNTLGLSILVTAQTRCGSSVAPNLSHLQSLGPLAQFADSVFAIGKTAAGPEARCLKHLRSCTAGLSRASTPPQFRITKLNGNFPAFETISDAVDDRPAGPDWPLIDRIKDLSDTGHSLREIAARLNISKTKTHRLLQQWIPRKSNAFSKSNAFTREPDAINTQPGDKPEYTADAADRRVDFTPEGVTLTEPRIHQEEYHGQHTDWYLESIGMKPVWREKLQSAECGVRNGESSLGDNGEMSDAEAIDALCTQFADRSEATPESSGSFCVLNSQLSIKKDAAGDDIYVEKEDEHGVPMIWYKIDGSGTIFRKVRDTLGIVCGVVPSLPSVQQYAS